MIMIKYLNGAYLLEPLRISPKSGQIQAQRRREGCYQGFLYKETF
jgi:hypothetical protein